MIWDSENYEWGIKNKNKEITMKAGFIGLGIMGNHMANNLLNAGCELFVNDVNEEAVKRVVSWGGKAATYEEIGKECSVVLISVPTGAITKSILFEYGLADALSEGSVVCDLSSCTPVESRECYDGLKAKNIGFLDAPVSGGEPGAIAGTLAIMVGGEESDFEKMKPYFDIIGSSAVYVGKSGSGSTTKLANQIIVNNNIAVVAEALVFATKMGVDPAKVYEAIRGGLAGSAVLDAKAPMMIEHNFKPGGPIYINWKDIKNVTDTARSQDITVPYSAQLFEIMKYLKLHGHINDDHSVIARYFEELCGVEIGDIENE